jgi:hypothetical protein
MFNDENHPNLNEDNVDYTMFSTPPKRKNKSFIEYYGV